MTLKSGLEVNQGLASWLLFSNKVQFSSRSLKFVPFESLGAVSYSPFVVTMAGSVAVCEIFSVKEWRDLENQVRGRSRSIKWRRSIDHVRLLISPPL